MSYLLICKLHKYTNMQINNFKRLQEEDEETYRRKHEEKVLTNIMSSLSAFRLVGQMVEMYLPKIFEMFVVAMGGRMQDNVPHSRSTPPSQAPDHQNGKRSPGDSTQDDISRIS